jgi:hypothetical protein
MASLKTSCANGSLISGHGKPTYTIEDKKIDL